jgi:predicted O-methyltransferase YrrM
MPWWSFLAINHADKILGGKKIFEWGTGGSTLRYSRQGAFITAVEHDKKWLQAVSQKLSEENLDHTNIHYCPLENPSDSDFVNSDYYKFLNEDYDVIIIDGFDDSFGLRPLCFYRAEEYIRNGGIIIVDDFWRYESILSRNKAKRWKVFESVGPCRFGVTSTAFFYY